MATSRARRLTGTCNHCQVVSAVRAFFGVAGPGLQPAAEPFYAAPPAGGTCVIPGLGRSHSRRGS
jgi:hypothetical protein